MSRAEDRALEKYPIEMYEEVGWRCVDKNTHKWKFCKPVMKVKRCKKLGGRKVPQSCHVLNGRKDYCESLFATDEQEETKLSQDQESWFDD